MHKKWTGFAAMNAGPIDAPSRKEAKPAYTPPRVSSTTKCKPHVLAVSGPCGSFTVTWQTARSLASLVDVGPDGVTTPEVNSRAFRLSAYVHSLRRQHQLVVETRREPYEGGWYRLYVLSSPVALERW